MLIPHDDARGMCESILQALDVPRDEAALLTDIHIDAELRGEQSHGLRCLLLHYGRIEAGTMRRKLKVTVLLDRGAVGLFDAHHSIGQVIGARAMRLAIAKAKEFGVGVVGIRNNNSITSLKYYTLMAVQEGMIGLVYTNTRPMIPPHGGMTSTVGNNPVSIAAPAGAEFPFVLDMACATAKEKIFQAAAENRSIPPDWALGRDGSPTTDPKEALETGVLLPFGGYKAFGLALAHEILTSALCGGGSVHREGDRVSALRESLLCQPVFSDCEHRLVRPASAVPRPYRRDDPEGLGERLAPGCEPCLCARRNGISRDGGAEAGRHSHRSRCVERIPAMGPATESGPESAPAVSPSPLHRLQV